MVLEHTRRVTPHEGGGNCGRHGHTSLMIDPDIVLGGPAGRIRWQTSRRLFGNRPAGLILGSDWSQVPSAGKANDVTLSMNKILNTEMVEAIADALRKSSTPPQEATDKGTGEPSPESRQPQQPASGVLLFVADLLSNSALARFFDGGRPESAVLRGSLIGLASGVEAVTDANTADAQTRGSSHLAQC